MEFNRNVLEARIICRSVSRALHPGHVQLGTGSMQAKACGEPDLDHCAAYGWSKLALENDLSGLALFLYLHRPTTSSKTSPTSEVASSMLSKAYQCDDGNTIHCPTPGTSYHSLIHPWPEVSNFQQQTS